MTNGLIQHKTVAKSKGIPNETKTIEVNGTLKLHHVDILCLLDTHRLVCESKCSDFGINKFSVLTTVVFAVPSRFDISILGAYIPDNHTIFLQKIVN